MSSNSLTGTLPSGLSKLAYLSAANLAGNSLSGAVPVDFQFALLTSLNLADNALNGSLPRSLVQSANLM